MSDLQCMTGAPRDLSGEPARIQSTYGFDVPTDIGDLGNLDLQCRAQ